MTTTFDAKRRLGPPAPAQVFRGKSAKPTQLAKHGKDKDDDQKKRDYFYHRLHPIARPKRTIFGLGYDPGGERCAQRTCVQAKTLQHGPTFAHHAQSDIIAIKRL